MKWRFKKTQAEVKEIWAKTDTKPSSSTLTAHYINGKEIKHFSVNGKKVK